MHLLTPNPLLSSESKLESIRKDILAQVQNECWSRSQQLMKELADFIKVFQTVISDIHSIAQCSQKVGSPCFLPSLPRAHATEMLSHSLRVSDEFPMGLDALKLC